MPAVHVTSLASGALAAPALPLSLSPTVKSALEGIAAHNAARMSNSRLMSAVIYSLTALTLLCLACALALILAWLCVPLRGLIEGHRRGPAHPGTVQAHTVLYWVLLAAVVVVVTWLTGLMGWVIVTVVYLLACLLLMVYVGIRHCSTQRHHTGLPLPMEDPTVDKPPDSPPVPAQAFGPPPPASALAPPLTPLGRWWTSLPQRMGQGQGIMLGVFLVLAVVFAAASTLTFFLWKVPDYQVWWGSRSAVRLEVVPQTEAKVLALMYSWGHLATSLRLGIYTKWFTNYCGIAYTVFLPHESRKKKLYDDWIVPYGIDMSICAPSDYMQYSTTNELFTRKLNASLHVRPLGAGDLLSPCDCRALAFPNLDSAKIWVKGDTYTVDELLGGDANLSAVLRGGWVFIGRLTPQDYHRIQVPVTGTVTQIRSIPGTYWGVSDEAVQSENKVFLNVRTVVVLQTPGGFTVAVIFVGATCIASVVLSPWVVVGATAQLGQELGYFQFGGSTMLVLVQPGTVAEVEPTLVGASGYPVETYILLNSAVANFTAKEEALPASVLVRQETD